MIDFPDNEREVVERELKRLGYTITGGGMDLLGNFDVFIEDPDNPKREVRFSSEAEVLAYHRKRETDRLNRMFT